MKKDSPSPPAPRTGTDRASDFRDKLASEGLKRYELYISDLTRGQIREIAAREGVTPGVAAEALLKLGIESYHAKPVLDALAAAPAVASVSAPLAAAAERDFPMGAALSGADPGRSVARSKPEDAAAGPAKRSAPPPAPPSSAKTAPTGPPLTKGLASYTERSEVRSLSPATPNTDETTSSTRRKSASVTRNLVAAAQRRKKNTEPGA